MQAFKDPCQMAATTLLAYATYITATCPCRKINGCHYNEYFLSVGLASLLILKSNGGFVKG